MNRTPHIPLARLLARAGMALVFALLPAVPAAAQDGFNIPFSQFGFGTSEQPYNLPIVSRMGGVVYTRSGNNYINPFNPASYGSVQTESFVFDMGVGLQTSVLRDAQQSAFDADGNVAYLLMGMPVTPWMKVALGLMPYTSVDYRSTHLGTDPTYPDSVKTVYSGDGGISQAFLGVAFNVLRGDGHRPDIQAGVNVNYLTGRINRAISYAFLDIDTTNYFLNKRRYKLTTVNDFTFDFGVQVRQPLGGKYTLGLGLVYKPYMDFKVSDMALIYTYHNADSYEGLIDTIFPARGADPSFDSRGEQASTFGVGLSLEREKRWMVALDATFGQWNGIRYTEGQTPSVFGVSSLQYGPYRRYAAGFERVGDMDASTYWGRITWSLGLHRETGVLHLNLNGTAQRIDEWGAGAGLTLPMRKGRSLLTLSAAMSRMGTTSMLRRDTFTFGIAVSSCERWFFKRKYN